jgi:hypothetical protein
MLGCSHELPAPAETAELRRWRRPDRKRRLVLVHGWGMNAGVWEGLPQALAAPEEVIAVDLPGHGGAPFSDPASSWSLDHWADECLEQVAEQQSPRSGSAGPSAGWSRCRRRGSRRSGCRAGAAGVDAAFRARRGLAGSGAGGHAGAVPRRPAGGPQRHAGTLPRVAGPRQRRPARPTAPPARGHGDAPGAGPGGAGQGPGTAARGGPARPAAGHPSADPVAVRRARHPGRRPPWPSARAADARGPQPGSSPAPPRALAVPRRCRCRRDQRLFGRSAYEPDRQGRGPRRLRRRRRRLRCRRRAAAEIGQRMLERLDYIRLQPMRVLDLGCGTGFALDGLAKRATAAPLHRTGFRRRHAGQARRRGTG